MWLWRIIYDIATDIKLLELPFFYYSREGGLSNNVALFSKGAFKRGKWKALSSSDSLNRERATSSPMHKRWLRFPVWTLLIESGLQFLWAVPLPHKQWICGRLCLKWMWNICNGWENSLKIDALIHLCGATLWAWNCDHRMRIDCCLRHNLYQITQL